ncbi:MAG: hypothetical protein JO205_05210 [Pseudolabrys sp.]|nr:hypothetical protein [Pseudolabrys sp.]
MLRNTALRNDLILAAGLIALDVAARLLPHEPNFTPIAASALFAGTVMRMRSLAFVVPLAAMLISDAVIGPDVRAITLTVYAMFMLPALVAYLPGRLRAPGMFAPVIVAYSLLFYVVTNFVTWAAADMYPHTFAGLATCYAAALPYLPQTVVGDLFWAALLFGGAALVRHLPLGSQRAA